MTPKISRFFAEHRPATPCLVVDLDVVESRYQALHHNLPSARIYYAIKANPAPQILRRLTELGSSFDAASIEEIRMCLAAGATPDRISYGNTVKKVSAIREAHELGIDLFVFDSMEELAKLAEHAPGARVFCRLTVENEGADWPLSRKFGTTTTHARELMLRAATMGLRPYGLSFHVGSQQTSVTAYETAIARASALYRDLQDEGLDLQMLNLGGGFPARYREDVPTIGQFCTAISQALTEHFHNDLPDILVEPGRYMVGEAGVVSSEVVLVSRRGGAPTDPRWVYLDIGRFGGLAETEGEAIRYTFRTPHDESDPDHSPCVLAGPSCDGVDIMYEKARIPLPNSLRDGDRVDILATGAYVSTYCSTGFNGFPPLAEHYI
ncbi:type III PLP-dependent enzyme [Gluconobacter wancherniae]|uniref:ornithine decarboxylase n=1 Tax=Gluconobacter wancherniae NBRC 103581 TaxID=656744 RepID=A0A511AZ54_9PROT|nr:type III PLP-dependent enzyme [Gluconobacter wancherniae]MBF0852633.1 type III PLP-dependent enzyme [Gluconobacter wancherniae]MBS1062023.1 type III PLP-dependent enzyme [Gluconobacter wancherniae]MBS1093203.1 type III PLP-dependent enzyme [Gluconobacter wancherniae]GBD56655.1 ornithine decarboxylase [Gluconobacter wancherniae NBRC 103581]GBR64292.1 diaminopimelate decarboxylase [Gluconobacter wancherniae NBRC 103581]